MSINDEFIKDLCEEERLFPIVPQIQADPCIRHLFISEEINRELTNLQPNQDFASDWAAARAIMDDFVAGRVISVKTGKKINDAMMGLLNPEKDGVWAMLAIAKKPGIRILGQFIRKDMLVALTWVERKALEDYGSNQWNVMINRCKSEWKKLFLTYLPLQEEDVHAYISDAEFRERKKSKS